MHRVPKANRSELVIRHEGFYSWFVKYSLFQLALPSIPTDFVLYNLQVESQVLAGNRLKDSPRKHHYVLQSRRKKPQMVIFHLSGYFGNGAQNFNQKTLESNLAEQIINLTRRGKTPSALHVFVDGMTGWGGSQFINSDLFGRHSDHLQLELTALIQDIFSVDKKAAWVLMGSSSGGYGALHHLAQVQSRFELAIAISPDSDFQTSLLPEFYKVAPYLREYSSVSYVQKELQGQRLQKKKNFFDIMNTLAMTGCYSPLKGTKLLFPIDLQTGELNKALWKQWQQKDPVVFLEKQARHLKNKKVYLDVGLYDDFSLYFGARKIREVLQRKKIKTLFQEFPGTHFGLNERKMKALEWLKKY
jgi:pimeloyl-ACP methyl ester carboxylesterase